jgi:hypothetical protein
MLWIFKITFWKKRKDEPLYKFRNTISKIVFFLSRIMLFSSAESKTGLIHYCCSIFSYTVPARSLRSNHLPHWVWGRLFLCSWFANISQKLLLKLPLYLFSDDGSQIEFHGLSCDIKKNHTHHQFYLQMSGMCRTHDAKNSAQWAAQVQIKQFVAWTHFYPRARRALRVVFALLFFLL